MATLVVQQSPFRQSRSPSPLPTGVTMDASKFKTNKHIPYCHPGAVNGTRSSRSSTPVPKHHEGEEKTILASILHPSKAHRQVANDPAVFAIDAPTLAAAERQIATTPLPDPKLVFPWLHGLHPENQIQLAFFMARRKNIRKTPTGIRGLTIVKAGSDLTKAKLKGAILSDEILRPAGPRESSFPEIDPRDGFSVRNFHIQVAKLATISDIVVYKDDKTSDETLFTIAKKIALAQRRYRECNATEGGLEEEYSTFVLSTPFRELERKFPELVGIDSKGNDTGHVIDFSHMERQEMCTMTKASEIAPNVWLGPTPDPTILVTDDETPDFDVLVEAADGAQMPETKELDRITAGCERCQQNIEFPSSGSLAMPMWSYSDVDNLMNMCKWMYALANPGCNGNGADGAEPGAPKDEDGDIEMQPIQPTGKKILIHCADGYTESSLLALTYFMFVECIPVHEAWIKMHCERQRNFFAYATDVSLLKSIQPRIMQESPKNEGGISSSLPQEPSWLCRLDGSLPSRLLPYLYLGNLAHANNPELLTAMGIRRVLSVGEPVRWTQEQLSSWGHRNLLYIDKVQDNGCDSLTDEFTRCLDFIREGKKQGTATLVHCRVGVSRSATICIAEIMASTGMSFPRAYCFVRARRLNVIIQPHLRFAYELLKWEEKQLLERGQPLRRELEWATIAYEIAAMNKPYTR